MMTAVRITVLIAAAFLCHDATAAPQLASTHPAYRLRNAHCVDLIRTVPRFHTKRCTKRSPYELVCSWGGGSASASGGSSGGGGGGGGGSGFSGVGSGSHASHGGAGIISSGAVPGGITPTTPIAVVPLPNSPWLNLLLLAAGIGLIAYRKHRPGRF